jgi:hypothetical protein
MPKSMVDRVNYIGRDQPIQPVFLDRAGNPIGDGDVTMRRILQTQPRTYQVK